MTRALLGRDGVSVEAEGNYVVIRQASKHGSDETVRIEPEDVPRIVTWLQEVAGEIKSPPPADAP